VVNSVDYEIKLNVGAAQIGKAMQVFGLSPTGGAERKIWFGEIRTGRDGRDALPLLARGVIIRVRAKAKSGDVTIKLRGPDGCLDVKAWSKHAESFTGKAKIEGDWADRRLVSASLESKFGEAGRAELDTDEPSMAKLLSSEQQQLAWELFAVPRDLGGRRRRSRDSPTCPRGTGPERGPHARSRPRAEDHQGPEASRAPGAMTRPARPGECPVVLGACP
jgi:hypothetical protein